MESAPLWVPVLVAMLGVGGTLAAALLTQRHASRREDHRWERERLKERDLLEAQRDDEHRQWLRDKRHELYSELVREATHFAAELVPLNDMAQRVWREDSELYKSRRRYFELIYGLPSWPLHLCKDSCVGPVTSPRMSGIGRGTTTKRCASTSRSGCAKALTSPRRWKTLRERNSICPRGAFRVTKWEAEAPLPNVVEIYVARSPSTVPTHELKDAPTFLVGAMPSSIGTRAAPVRRLSGSVPSDCPRPQRPTGASGHRWSGAGRAPLSMRPVRVGAAHGYEEPGSHRCLGGFVTESVGR